MLTLEQVRAVNDGFHRGDLAAALAPLEETIDLRANELPRLDKQAVAALKDGLQNGDDAATWAQAILHPNVSVRRFARKVFVGLGNEAALIFEPLRARLERFWGEESPLPESNKPREAALRREQNEQIASALEILLRANPESFMDFYARLADSTPLENQLSTEMQAWAERNRIAWDATQKETSRLLEAEWGVEWVDPQKRWKLPSRALRELDERARRKPEIARMWEELGENPWQNVAPAWNPVGSVMATWSGYLGDSKPTGPIERVNARLRPVLWNWIEGAFDFEREASERERLVRRLMRSYLGYQLGGWLGREGLIERAPALLLEAKKHLLAQIQAMLKNCVSIISQGWHLQKGDELVAALWLNLANVLGHTFHEPYHVKPESWKAPSIELETLRALLAEFPVDENSSRFLANLRIAAHHIEKARQMPTTSAPTSKTFAEPLVATSHKTDRDLLSERLGYYANDQLYPNLEAVRAKLQSLDAEAAQLKDEERVTRLVESAPHPNDPQRVLLRLPYWKIWSKAPDENGAAKLKIALWPRAEPLLWARFEQQLQAHRRLETEPIEPDIAQKLTEREAKEWRTRVRREKRQFIAQDALDIANLLIYVDGLPAQLKAIELADRPGCREIRDQLERQLFGQLQSYPGEHRLSAPATPEAWEKWKLDETWDAISAKMEARLPDVKDQWWRTALELQLATGYYRRGDFARFKSHFKPENFPVAVAAAAFAFDDFAAWRALLPALTGWQDEALKAFWEAQQTDAARRARALEAVVQLVAATSSEAVAKSLLQWLDPVKTAEFAPHVSELENALESPIANVKKWAMKTLGALPDADFDRERAAGTAGEALWSENAGLAKDAAKLLAQLALQDATVAELAWAQLEDATALENIGLCEAVFRALVKIQSKNKALELGDAAREKLALLSGVNGERFGKFGAKLAI